MFREEQTSQGSQSQENSMLGNVHSSIQQLRRYREDPHLSHQKSETPSQLRSIREDEQVVFKTLYSRFQYYDGLIQSSTSQSEKGSKNFAEDSIRSLIQNDSNQMISNLVQTLESLRSDFGNSSSSLKGMLQSSAKIRDKKESIQQELDKREERIGELIEMEQDQCKELERVIRSSEEERKALEREIMGEIFDESKIKIEYELAKEILGDQFQAQLMEYVADMESLPFGVAREVDEKHLGLIQVVNGLRERSNIQQQYQALDQYMISLEENNVLLEEDSRKVMELLDQLKLHSEPHGEDFGGVSTFPIKTLLQKHNDPYYRQKQIKIIQQQFNSFQGAIHDFITSLDTMRGPHFLLSQIQEGIQRNVSKQQTINSINSQIVSLQNKLANSNNLDSDSKERLRRKAEEELGQCESKQEEIRNLLEEQEMKIAELKGQIEEEMEKGRRNREKERARKVQEEERRERGEKRFDKYAKEKESKLDESIRVDEDYEGTSFLDFSRSSIVSHRKSPKKSGKVRKRNNSIKK